MYIYHPNGKIIAYNRAKGGKVLKFYKVPEAEMKIFWSIAGQYFYDQFIESLKAINANYEQLMRVEELRSEVLRIRAYCCLQLHDYVSSLRNYGEALKLDPNNKKIRENYENVQSELFREMSRKMDESLWDELLELTDAYLEYANNINVLWFKSVALDSKGKSLEAQKILGEVIKSKPLDSFYYCSYIIICRHLSDIDTALAVGCQALEYLRKNGRKCADLQQLIEEIKGGGNVSQLRIVRKSDNDGSQVH